MHYRGVWLLLFVVTAILNILPNPLSVLTVTCPAFLYVVPVAVCTHFRQWRQSVGLIVGALLAALAGGCYLVMSLWRQGYTQLTTTQLAGVVAMSAVNAVVIAAVGLPIGLGTARGWTYSRVLVTTVSPLFAVVATYFALCRDSFSRVIDAMTSVMIEQLNKQAADRGPELTERLIDRVQLFGENKFAFAVGFEFGIYLAITCVLVSITTAMLRRKFGDSGPIGSFRDMHPPDWLVWVGIVVAALWFIERQYGGGELRFVTWNVAVGLGSIYFLNGCAIFIYGMQVFAPGLFLTALLVCILLMSALFPVLSMIGLFDTWANFRMRMDRLAEAIRNARSGDGST